MIVFDENVHQRSIIDGVAAWYRGRVVSVTVLRPGYNWQPAYWLGGIRHKEGVTVL